MLSKTKKQCFLSEIDIAVRLSAGNANEEHCPTAKHSPDFGMITSLHP